jgi:alkylhydroperoxidase/carboxymuconolactone decarboxylase family protein YurZ
MAEVATPELLDHLRSLYPSQSNYLENPWYIAAAVAFSASNLPDAVPLVLQYALKDLKAQPSFNHEDDSLLLIRKIRDALFKSGLLSGYPKAINAMAALYRVLPDHLKDTKPLRDVSMSNESLARIGQDHFNLTYGETAGNVQAFLKNICPDFEFFSTAFAYGYVYAFPQVLSGIETSFAMVAALIASDTPKQIDWHLKGAVRNGAKISELQAVRKISIEVAQASGVVWKHEIPDV